MSANAGASERCLRPPVGRVEGMSVRRIPPDEVPRDRSAIEGDGFTATFAAFDASPRQDTWHHHGDHDIVAYLLAGSIDIEAPDDGVIEMRPGDLVHIERRTVHREVYLGHIEMVGFDVGVGPGRIEANEQSAHEPQDNKHATTEGDTEKDITDAFE
jgi:quercetin dioxygenase-like cupin family protein